MRAIRLRSGLTQAAVAAAARVSRSTVSLVERGAAARLSHASIDGVLTVLGARLDMRLLWKGTELDRLADSVHSTLVAAVKARLERWSWVVRVEVSRLETERAQRPRMPPDFAGEIGRFGVPLATGG